MQSRMDRSVRATYFLVCISSNNLTSKSRPVIQPGRLFHPYPCKWMSLWIFRSLRRHRTCPCQDSLAFHHCRLIRIGSDRPMCR